MRRPWHGCWMRKCWASACCPPPAALLGIQVDGRPLNPLPAGISFVVCRAELIPKLVDIQLPKLVLVANDAEVLPGSAGIFGSIQAAIRC